MSKPAIIIDNISKAYRIGLKEKANQSFREAFTGALAAPFRRLRGLGAEAGNGDDTFWALKDVSFEVQPGEVVGIIGRNGAGKSTLLKVLSRITEPTSGRAVLRGRVASLLEVGTGFHPELTGRENIYLNGAILGMKRAEIARKFDEIVAFAEIDKFLDTPVKRYSSGMYVRLAFAVAAHLEPEILIVDEVLAVGDAEFQKKCLGKMQEVSTGGGRTVLFVSHNMLAISALCRRAVVLADGRVTIAATTSDAIAAYRRLSGGEHASSGCFLRTSPKIKWLGRSPCNEAASCRLGEDLRLTFGFEVGDVPLETLQIDCAIVNVSGQMVVHAKSKVVSDPFGMPSRQRFSASYHFTQPRLAPGYYTLVIYVKSGNEVLFWAEGIDGVDVPASLDFGRALALDELKGQVLPRYKLEVDCDD